MADTTTAPATRARGKVISTSEGMCVFAPSGTNYEMSLVCPKFEGALNTLTECVIRATARKVLTVPSGGNFISPIYGSPRTIQGRVRAIEGQRLVIHAGTTIVIDLPREESAVDLNSGPITIGSMVNVSAMPGTKFEKA